ncbi:MAG: pyridoxal kinase [Proteobacteria bacterium]|nr:pyridoxal kinase [Pseudomonadota bacterium]MBI3500153.1 pyridoxal kinase [Pseudomonadota bacterium]
MAILSIQSAVVFGHVGNSVAALPLERLGHEVWRLDTVCFSNHPGHGKFRGRVVPADELAALLDGVDALGVIGKCQGVLTGYLGEAANAGVAADAVTRAKRANAGVRYLLDPVIGDDRRTYVRAGVPEAIRAELLPLADIVKPNAYELGYLTGRSIDGPQSAVLAAKELLRLGPRAVVVTGLRADDRIDMLAVAGDGVWRVSARLSPRSYNGTGDLIAALLLGHYLATGSLASSLQLAASGVAEAIQATEASGERELTLVPSLERIVAPPTLLAIERLE